MLRDYPAIQGSDFHVWNDWSKEREELMPLAARHLSAFAKFYEKGEFKGWATELAAVMYARANGLPDRFALHQNIAQLYEQQALSKINPFPGVTNSRCRVVVKEARPAAPAA